jgi:hypothetical protein
LIWLFFSALGQVVILVNQLMYATSDISPFVQRSQDTADFFVGMRNAYAATRRSLGRFAGGALAILVVPIVAIATWFFLRNQRNQLKKLLSINVDLTNYKKTRLEYDRLNAIFDVIGDRKLDKIISRTPWLLRVILRLMNDILQLIRQRRDAIGQALAQLDATAPRTDLLKPAAEAELWEHRTKAYDYRF